MDVGILPVKSLVVAKQRRADRAGVWPPQPSDICRHRSKSKAQMLATRSPPRGARHRPSRGCGRVARKARGGIDEFGPGRGPLAGARAVELNSAVATRGCGLGTLDGHLLRTGT